MKYLKTFESKSVYKFEPIGETEWYDLIGLSIDFPENQIREIQSLLTDVTIRARRQRHPYLEIIGREYFELNCLPDEWYLVRGGKNLYKCDQFDGLLDCLEFLKGKHIS